MKDTEDDPGGGFGVSPAFSFSAGDESALIVPAPEVASLVEPFRMRHDPSARAGVPPHITVMYPFLEPARLTGDVLVALDRLLASTHAFEYALTEVREFEGGVLYLAPQPPEPFIALTRQVGEAFNLALYGGAYRVVVPHLTVAQTATHLERKQIAEVLKRSLPQDGLASVAWLMVGSNEKGWRKSLALNFEGRINRTR
jgi:2'-5' RNA ligase